MTMDQIIISDALRYDRPALPPPGPRWRKLMGKEDLVVSLVSLYIVENTGIRLLAAMLRNLGVRVHEIYFKDWVTNRVDPPTQKEVAQLLEELRQRGTDLVGISVRASAFHRLAQLLTEGIRSELDLPVLWGGMHASSCPEDAIAVADIIAIGEAETSLPQAIQRLRNNQSIVDVAGLWVHDEDGIVKNPVAPLIQDLDRLPLPDYHSRDKVLLEGGKVIAGDPYAQQPIYLLMASRGCPFPSCTFCSNSVLDRIYDGQPIFRLRSLDHVFAEVQYARKHFPNLRRIRFDDEEFPVRKGWFDEFCRRWPEEGGVPFEIHMDPRVVSLDRLQRLKAVGLDTAFMGIQSTAKVNRELYCRDVSDEQVLAAAKAIHDSGVRAGYQVILDDPVSTAADKEQLFKLLLRIPRPYEMILFSLTVYPGSKLAESLLALGLIAPDDIEGRATKVFRQFRVDLSFPRPAEDQFWTALTVLLSKDFIPKELLVRLARSRKLQANPGPLTAFAYAANVAKLGIMGVQLTLRGEMSWAIVKRWLNFKSLVTY
jgi:anaerobic magnesium-protoporphyrin IX monomethyl ester cyclase